MKDYFWYAFCLTKTWYLLYGGFICQIKPDARDRLYHRSGWLDSAHPALSKGFAMDSKIFAIVLDAVKDAFPLPDFSNQNEVRSWVMELSGDAVDLAYSLGGSEQALVQIPQLVADVEVLTEEEFTSKMALCAAENTGRFGDGAIIDRIKKVDWSKVMQLVMTIIALFPKATPTVQE